VILEDVVDDRVRCTHAEDSCVSQDTMAIGWWLLFVVISQLESYHAYPYGPGNIAQRLCMFDIIICPTVIAWDRLSSLFLRVSVCLSVFVHSPSRNFLIDFRHIAPSHPHFAPKTRNLGRE